MDDPRFWAKVDKSGECWLWTGAHARGYGILTRHSRVRRAARYVLELVSGQPCPPDLTVDHLCRTPMCVRPSHLELVPFAENHRRKSAHYRATHPECPKGHGPYAETADGRRCRKCRAERQQAYRERQAA